MKWGNAVAGCVVISAMSIQVGCGESGDSSSSTQLQKPIVLISTEPADVVRGSYLTIHWSTTGATDCLASGAWSGVRPISGSETFLTTDSGMIKFTLSCTGAGGSTTNTAKSPVHRGISPP